jgi:hypothetical protein
MHRSKFFVNSNGSGNFIEIRNPVMENYLIYRIPQRVRGKFFQSIYIFKFHFYNVKRAGFAQNKHLII